MSVLGNIFWLYNIKLHDSFSGVFFFFFLFLNFVCFFFFLFRRQISYQSEAPASI
jgi:hypothetical protein